MRSAEEELTELNEWIEEAAARLTRMIDNDIKEKYEFKAAPNIKGFSDYYPQRTAYLYEECIHCGLYCTLKEHECHVMSTALVRIEHTPIFSIYWYYYCHQDMWCPSFIVRRRFLILYSVSITIRGIKIHTEGWRGVYGS